MQAFDWGCSCGRLCVAEDDECESCDAVRSSGKPLRTPAERALARTDNFLQAIEQSYVDAGTEMDRHIMAMYGDLNDWFYDREEQPWMWG